MAFPRGINSATVARPTVGPVSGNQVGITGTVTVDGSAVTQPIQITDVNNNSVTVGISPASTSLSVVLASDATPVTVRTSDPLAVTNPVDSDAKVPLVVQTVGSDIQNIINPVTVANLPAVQSVSGTVGASQQGVWSVLTPSVPPLGQTGSTGSLPVVIAADQGAIPVYEATPVQVVNPTVNDQLNPLVVQTTASDIENIKNPVTVANFPTSFSISGPVVNAQTSPWQDNIVQINGQAPSAQNALPVQLSDGGAFSDLASLLRQQITLQTMQISQSIFQSQNPAGFLPMEVPAFLGA